MSSTFKDLPLEFWLEVFNLYYPTMGFLPPPPRLASPSSINFLKQQVRITDIEKLLVADEILLNVSKTSSHLTEAATMFLYERNNKHKENHQTWDAAVRAHQTWLVEAEEEMDRWWNKHWLRVCTFAYTGLFSNVGTDSLSAD